MMMYKQLGMIPAWQFSQDPAVNPKINPFVQFPDGVYQTTMQPLGPFFNPPPFPPGSAAPALGAAGCDPWDGCYPWPASPAPRLMRPRSPYALRGLGIDNPFDSWWWQNRQWLALDALCVVGVLMVGTVAAVLR